MESPAIQNLDYLRQLILDARQAESQRDAERLRMFQGYGVGTDALTVKQGDR
jgi:hypothetical protein